MRYCRQQAALLVLFLFLDSRKYADTGLSGNQACERTRPANLLVLLVPQKCDANCDVCNV